MGPFLQCKYKILSTSLRRILGGCQCCWWSSYHTSSFKRCQKWKRAASSLFAHFTVNCASVCMVILRAVAHRTVHTHRTAAPGTEQGEMKNILCKYMLLQTVPEIWQSTFISLANTLDLCLSIEYITNSLEVTYWLVCDSVIVSLVTVDNRLVYFPIHPGTLSAMVWMWEYLCTYTHAGAFTRSIRQICLSSRGKDGYWKLLTFHYSATKDMNHQHSGDKYFLNI